MYEMTEVLEFPGEWECVTCGHEWPREDQPDVPDVVRVVKGAYGNMLAGGDWVVLIKDSKLGGGSQCDERNCGKNQERKVLVEFHGELLVASTLNLPRTL